MSSATVRPSGPPPNRRPWAFCLSRSACPLLSTAKASNTQCTPRSTRLRPFCMIICHRPLGKLRTCLGLTVPLLSLLIDAVHLVGHERKVVEQVVLGPVA